MATFSQRLASQGFVDSNHIGDDFTSALQNPNSILSFVVNDYDSLTREIVSGLSAGTDAGRLRADAAREKLNATIDDNQDLLNGILVHPAIKKVPGFAQYYGAKTEQVMAHSFNDREVKLPDGTTVTVGQFYQNPGQYSRSFGHHGFASEVYNAYMDGSDPELTRMLSPFVSPVLGAVKDKTPVPDQVQNSDGALAVFQHASAIKGTFGAGSDLFTSQLHGVLKDVGCYSGMIPALCQYADGKSRNSNGALSGSALASSVVGDLQSLYDSAVESESVDPETGRRGNLPSCTRTVIAQTVIKGLTAMAEAGEFADISSPVKKRALMEGLSIRAKAEAAGYGEVFNDSGTASWFGDHVAFAGTSRQGQDRLSQLIGYDGRPGFRQNIEALVTGANTFTPDKDVMSAGTGRFRTVRGATGGVSMSPTLDLATRDVLDYITFAKFYPQMKDGRTPEEIRINYQTDINGMQDLTKSVQDRVKRAFGFRTDEASAVLTNAVLGSIFKGVPVNIQDLIEAQITGTASGSVKVPKAVADDFSTVYYSAVRAPQRFAPEYNAALAQLMDPVTGEGLPETQARRLLQVTDAENSRTLSNGAPRGLTIDPVANYRAIANSGYVYLPMGEKIDLGNGEVNRMVKIPSADLEKSMNDLFNGEDFQTQVSRDQLRAMPLAARKALFRQTMMNNKAVYENEVRFLKGIQSAHDRRIASENARNEAQEMSLN